MQSCKLLLTCMLLFQRLGLFYFSSTSCVFDSMYLSKGGIHGYIGYPPKSATAEDISKNRPGDLKGRKQKLIQHENGDNPQHCFVWLYKPYNRLCPIDWTEDALYLQPLTNPSPMWWYSSRHYGHNWLPSTVARLCKEAGGPGYKSNHSLRVTNATWLNDSHINLPWKGLATWVLKECEHTSKQVIHSVKPFQISWMEQRDIVPALPHWLLLLQLAVEFQPDLSNSVISSNRPINFKLHHYQEICGVISVSQSPSTSPLPEVAS